jgi:hypothetical protein
VSFRRFQHLPKVGDVFHDFLNRSPNLCSHVLAAMLGAQLKHENFSDFPADLRNPNKRREGLKPKITSARARSILPLSILPKFMPTFTWASVQQCMSTSPKDFMPAGIGEKKPKDVKLFDIGDQGQKKKKKKADGAPAALAARGKAIPIVAPVVLAVPAGGADAAAAAAQLPPVKRRRKTTESARPAVAAPVKNDDDDDEQPPPPPPIVAPARDPPVRAKDFGEIAQSAAANPAAGRAKRDRRKRTLMDL